MLARSSLLRGEQRRGVAERPWRGARTLCGSVTSQVPIPVATAAKDALNNEISSVLADAPMRARRSLSVLIEV